MGGKSDHSKKVGRKRISGMSGIFGVWNVMIYGHLGPPDSCSRNAL